MSGGPTEEHRHGFVSPPAEERNERRPKEQELDAHVDRAGLSTALRRLRGAAEE